MDFERKRKKRNKQTNDCPKFRKDRSTALFCCVCSPAPRSSHPALRSTAQGGRECRGCGKGEQAQHLHPQRSKTRRTEWKFASSLIWRSLCRGNVAKVRRINGAVAAGTLSVFNLISLFLFFSDVFVAHSKMIDRSMVSCAAISSPISARNAT